METALDIILLLKLLSAHLLSDFIFQPKKWVKEKNNHPLKSKFFYYHILVTASILMLFTWGNWKVSLILTIAHFTIDLVKSLFDDKNIIIFIIDQILHLISILIVWLAFTQQFPIFIDQVIDTFINPKYLLIFLGFMLLSEPVSILITKIVSKWKPEISVNKGLKHAGKIIGYLERFLIFIFMLLNNYTVLGSFLAAKSIFRFGDLSNPQDHKKTEYIIIGTFLSFSIAIFTGLLIKLFI